MSVSVALTLGLGAGSVDCIALGVLHGSSMRYTLSVGFVQSSMRIKSFLLFGDAATPTTNPSLTFELFAGKPPSSQRVTGERNCWATGRFPRWWIFSHHVSFTRLLLQSFNF